MNEVWNLGPQAPSGGWRAIRVDMPAARGVLEHASAPPSPCTDTPSQAGGEHALDVGPDYSFSGIHLPPRRAPR